MDRALSRMIPHLCPFELEMKMAEEDEIFRKCRRIAPELIADFEKPCFSLELEIFKSTRTRRLMVNQLQRWKHRVRANIFRIILHGICEKPSKLSCLQSYNKSLINQARSGLYWGNIGPRLFLYGPRCARSVLSRPRADILPVRPSRLVNKIYILLGGERHSECKVPCPRTQHNVPGQGSNPESTNHEAIAPSSVLAF